jgi:hypothetical protein
MLTRRRTGRTGVTPIVVVLAALDIVWATWPAHAGDGYGDVTCDENTGPGCTAVAGINDSDGTSGEAGRAGRASRRKSALCRNSVRALVPCVDPDLGSIHADGCYYKPPAIPQGQEDLLGARPDGPGAWYVRTCPGQVSPWTAAGVTWVPGRQAVPPQVVAQQATSRLRLPTMRIGSNPAAGVEQLVSLPVWLWIEPAGWGTRQATATVPGVSVTATATPTTVTWTLGDGNRLECRGPGRVFPPGGDPKTASPDCGHVYTRSSAGQPGDSFQVTATVSWAITWTGAGQSGVLPALTTTSATALRVAESQALAVPADP